MHVSSTLHNKLTRLFASLAVVIALSNVVSAVTVQLEEFDTLGGQIETIQIMDNGVDPPQSTFSLFDTGASVMTFSGPDAFIFDFVGSPIPLKDGVEAVAQAVGGTVTGDVSEPIGVGAVGLEAVQITVNGFLVDFTIDTTNAVTGPNLQTFVGQDLGNPFVPPTLTGTPILAPTPDNPNGLAAQIDMMGKELDLGALFPTLPEFQGISLFLPNLDFVQPGTSLADAGPDAGPNAAAAVAEVVRVPMEMLGESNLDNPGDNVSAFGNPFQTAVTAQEGAITSEPKKFLFDTGAQLSLISEELAFDVLGFDPLAPEGTIDVQGAAGNVVTIPQYTLDSLNMPLEGGDTLSFLDAPVFVLDAVEGIDGILGMNLFNTVEQMLFDPFGDPAGAGDARQSTGAGLELIFGTRETGLEELLALQEDPNLDPTTALAVDALLAGFGASLGFFDLSNPLTTIPGFQPEIGPSGGLAAIPEPGSLMLWLAGAGLLRLRKRNRR